MPDEVPVYQETMTSAAIDGARIAVAVAGTLVELDARLPESLRMQIIAFLEDARESLDDARLIIGMESTSHHIVQASSIIIPPGV